VTDAPLDPTPVSPGSISPAPVSPGPVSSGPVSSGPDDDSVVDDAIADDAAAAAKGHVGPLGVAAAIVFGLFYAYVLWQSLSRLIDLPNTFTSRGVEGVPWGLAIAAVLVPIVVFVLAFVIGLRRNVGHKAIVYIAGLLVVAALTLSLIGFENAVLAAAIAAK
jgi:hypothetical protein